MGSFIFILAIIAAILLALVILIQNPKGGGINSSLMGSSNQLGTVKKTTDTIEKFTWYLAIAILVISVSSKLFIDRSHSKNPGKELIEQEDKNKINFNVNNDVAPTLQPKSDNNN